MALKKFCAKRGCKRLTESKYCDDHAHLLQDDIAARNKFYDQHRRDQKAKKFYNSKEWEAVRQEALIRDHGLCHDCKANKQLVSADVVDHIKPIEHFWHLRIVLSNLRSLCHTHHNRKTAEDKKRYRGRGG